MLSANGAVSGSGLCYHSAMTIGITRRSRRAPWRGAVVVLIIAAIVLSICLILLGLTGDFLVDWLWFSTIGYLDVFWTTIVAEGEAFFAVLVATAIILWVNGSPRVPVRPVAREDECRSANIFREEGHRDEELVHI
jgi:uncharacterized protein